MEYERFFHFGHIAQAAKWYLLMGACDLPQRLLCTLQYAKKLKVPAHGQFPLYDDKGVKKIYTYIIYNIFDVPFADLNNFFHMVCENDDRASLAENVYNPVFKKEFNSAQNNQIAEVPIITNQIYLANDYLNGLETLVQPMNINVDQNVVACYGDVYQTNMEIAEDDEQPTTSARAMSTCKRRNTDNDNNQANNINTKRTTPSVDTQLPAITDVNENLDESEIVSIPETTLTTFPSITPTNFPSTTPTSFPTMSTIERKLDEFLPIDVVINKEKLSTVSDMMLTTDDHIIFGHMCQQYYYIDETPRAVFKYRNIQSTIVDKNDVEYGEISQTYKERYVELMKKTSGQINFVALFDDTKYIKPLLAGNYITDFQEFNKYCLENGEEIINIVDNSDSFEMFEQNVNNSQKPQYWFLYGLTVYMKMRNPKFTTRMEIDATIYWSAQEADRRVSEMMVRVYIALTNKFVAVTEYTTNLRHIEPPYIADTDMKGNLEVLDDMLRENYFETKVIPRIRASRKLPLHIVDNGTVINDSPFGLNIFSIDGNYMYIIMMDRKEYYLATYQLLAQRARNADVERSESLDNKPYDIFDGMTFKGRCYRSQ